MKPTMKAVNRALHALILRCRDADPARAERVDIQRDRLGFKAFASMHEHRVNYRRGEEANRLAGQQAAGPAPDQNRPDEVDDQWVVHSDEEESTPRRREHSDRQQGKA